MVHVYQQIDMDYLVNTGYIALNGIGTQTHGNYCWNDGNGKCRNAPLSFRLNETLNVTALNDGNFMLKNRQL